MKNGLVILVAAALIGGSGTEVLARGGHRGAEGGPGRAGHHAPGGDARASIRGFDSSA